MTDTAFAATAAPETFTAAHKVVEVDVLVEPDGAVEAAFSDAVSIAEAEAILGLIFFPEDIVAAPIIVPILGVAEAFEIVGDLSPVNSTSFFDVFDNDSVSYGQSTAGIFVDLTKNPQLSSNGFAFGDTLNNIYEITGSPFDDVIRGTNEIAATSGHTIINNPGDNVLSGGTGNDVLEGRGGADVLNGGSGSDIASYESSPAAVTVTLQDVDPLTGNVTQAAVAKGGDATGDTLVSIEGLVGSRFNDHLTGNSQNNTLAGGQGSDILNGEGGTDTADYSQDHLYDGGDGVDEVSVHLGLNGASGTGDEFIGTFDIHTLTVTFNKVSTDTLISIENVTGTDGNDEIVGNEQNNQLDGRGGNDVLDGGLGNDLLIGGSGSDTASYASHNGLPVLAGEQDNISLGLNGADGTYTRSHIASFLPLRIVTDETDTLRGIENITGSDHNETITGNEQNNVLDGGFGNDTLVGGGGNDTASFASHDSGPVATSEVNIISLGLNGADGSYTRESVSRTATGVQQQVVESDVLRGFANVIGSNRAETINGNEQDNILAGRGGDDTINGGAGNDTYDFRGANQGAEDQLFDSAGTDKILVDNLNEIQAPFRNGNDLFIGLTNGSTSIGSINIINHFSGNPIESIVDKQGNSLVLATGLIGTDKSGLIAGSDADDFMDGRGGDDYLFGSGGKDTLLGGAGDDHLDGGKGNDILDGGSGNDVLTGGKGSDTFVFEPIGSDGLPAGNDTITDFVHGEDRIDLSAFGINLADLFGSHDGHANHKDDGSSGFGPITITEDGGDTLLSFDGGSIRVVGVQDLQANDFLLQNSPLLGQNTA
jgi:Ca2+-binding RTX toxin-like protein